MYREAEGAAMRVSSTAIQMTGDDGNQWCSSFTLTPFFSVPLPSQRVPNFLRESVTDGGMARGVKQAYGTMDKLRYIHCHTYMSSNCKLYRISSVRVGLLLRRYPMARVFLFLYVVSWLFRSIDCI